MSHSHHNLLNQHLFCYYHGMPSNSAEFYSEAVSSDLDIIGLTETWQNSSINSLELFSSGYCVFRFDSSSSNHPTEFTREGSILIARKDTVFVEHIDMSLFVPNFPLLLMTLSCSLILQIL